MKPIPKLLFSFLFVVLVLGSCLKKEIFELDKIAKTKYTPEVAVPLVYTSLTLEDVIANANPDIIDVDNDGFITLVYDGRLISLMAKDALTFTAQSFNYDIQPGIDIPIGLPNGDTVSYSDLQTINFDAGTGNQLDSIVYKSADFNITVSSSFEADIDLTISIPSAKLGGSSFSQMMNIAPTSTESATFDMSGYTFDLTNGGTTTNEFSIYYKAVLTGTGMPVSASDQLSVSGTFDNLEFDKVFGQIDISGMVPDLDTVMISLFNLATGVGEFSLVSPSITINITNSFGIPIDASFSKLEGINTISGITHDITNNPDVPNPLPISSPTISQMGQSLTQSFTLANQGIVDLINDKPKFFVYQVDANSGVGGTGQNFVLDTSKIEIDTHIELPLHGTAKVFSMQDTIKLQLNFDGLEEFMLRIRIRNGFPIKVKTQMYFMDDLYNITDSVIPDNKVLMDEADIGSDGKAVGYTETILDIEFDPAKLSNARKAKQILLIGEASTYKDATENVKIYTDYSIEIKAGMVAKISTDF